MSNWSINLESATAIGKTLATSNPTFDQTGRVFEPRVLPNRTPTPKDIVVFPGLVNSHDHLRFSLYPRLGNPPYTNLDEWSRDVHELNRELIDSLESIPLPTRRYWGAIRNLVWGVTLIMDHDHPHMTAVDDLPIPVVSQYRFNHRAEDSFAWLTTLWSRGSGPLVFHVAEGTDPKLAKLATRYLRWAQRIGPLVGVHGICLEADAARQLDALVWCPESNEFLFGRTADVSALKHQTKILIGTDSPISSSGTIWDHLRMARSRGVLTDHELLLSVTDTARIVWGDRSNEDFVIARIDSADSMDAFFEIKPEKVLAVVSRGQLVLIREDFYRETGAMLIDDFFAHIDVEDRQYRLFCRDRKQLHGLATLDGSPVKIRRQN